MKGALIILLALCIREHTDKVHGLKRRLRLNLSMEDTDVVYEHLAT